MKNHKYKRLALIIIRKLLRIFLLIGAFFVIDMAYTIIVPERYYILEVNYIFLTIFLICGIIVNVITYKLNDFFLYEAESKIILICKIVILLGIIVYFIRLIYISFGEMTRTYMYYLKLLGKYTLKDAIGMTLIDYVIVLIVYFSVRKIVSYIPALLRKHENSEQTN